MFKLGLAWMVNLITLMD